jgi:hypothetical protein
MVGSFTAKEQNVESMLGEELYMSSVTLTTPE